jgi:ATP phosphoribosyltransferase
MEFENKNASPPGNCRFAIPKKGRLYEKVTEMLKGSGIKFHREPRLDVALCNDFPITIVFLPAADIVKYVGEGNVDIGITGIDVVEESDVKVDRIMDLGFGSCRLCVQAPVRENITNVEDLAGRRIVTSFPFLAKKYFDPIDAKKGVTTRINFVSGSVEAACGLGLADAVVDLVETGTTMRAAGLEVVAEILTTEAVLIGNPQAEHKDLVEMIKRRLEGYITATKYVLMIYNVHVDNLAAAVAITPGKRSPTITALDDGQCKSVSSLVLAKESNAIMDRLHEVGATDILVMNISNSRM